ncbi:MAG: sarcosine oxidase subunit delta [Hyphomicrobiales bacterium]|nr:sarcosine oxidase subunit delta [Hyphomicrobiales bacterium]
MLIHCPFCGARDHAEFSYAGDARLKRPAPDAPEAEWLDYAYQRDNPSGPHEELWHHVYGCRRHVAVTRHMSTHEILAARFAGTSGVES